MLVAIIGGILGLGAGCHIIRYCMEIIGHNQNRNLLSVICAQIVTLLSCIGLGATFLKSGYESIRQRWKNFFDMEA